MCHTTRYTAGWEPYPDGAHLDSPRSSDEAGRWLGIRVLVAFEDLYRAYRETIAAGIRVLRPHVEVTTTDVDNLETEVTRLNPRVIISTQDRPASLCSRVTWVQVPLESGSRSEVTLDTLLDAIDGAASASPPKVPGRSR
jgi:hypothetical protein